LQSWNILSRILGVYLAFHQGKIVNTRDLIAAAKNTKIDEQKIAALQERIRTAEKKFEAQARDRSVNKEFLSRTYSL